MNPENKAIKKEQGMKLTSKQKLENPTKKDELQGC